MTKLTLSVEEAVVEKAKRLAELNNTSVSAIFSQFVESTTTQSERRTRIGPLTRKLTGIVELPAAKDYKELLAESLMERYDIAK